VTRNIARNHVTLGACDGSAELPARKMGLMRAHPDVAGVGRARQAQRRRGTLLAAMARAASSCGKVDHAINVFG
jgi:hypothetical protein